MLELLSGALRISTPYTLAALGGMLSERSGVMNIALEGALLQGALAYAVATERSGNPWVGLLSAALVGALTMALHAALCLHARANHIISAVGINLLAAGSCRLILKALYGSAANGPRVAGFEQTAWHGVQGMPWVGGWLSTPLVLLGLVLVPVVHLVLTRTRWGLHVHVAGEHPEAAETRGLSVLRLRWSAVVLGGVLCGLGGAYLAAEQHQFTQNMSAGRGFIAVSAVVFGRWRPVPVWLGCMLFGFMEALQIHLQGTGAGIPTQLVQMIPYVATLAVLALGTARTRAPSALGIPWPPER